MMGVIGGSAIATFMLSEEKVSQFVSIPLIFFVYYPMGITFFCIFLL
jgi:hypothetical protein